MALFLKYRPQKFEDLVGQASVIKTLKNAIKSDTPSHAYLFYGSRGTGKTSTARIFARSLNCLNPNDGDPCGTCKSCSIDLEGKAIDIIEIDAASNRGIDEIRDLREKINFLPTHFKRKVYIIDEVHMLTIQAFNALLKTLEEPPDHAFFILATTEKHQLPETVTSRCQCFDFSRFSLEEIQKRLQLIADKENITIAPGAVTLISQQVEGGMRDALSLLDQLSSEYENNITQENAEKSLGIASSVVLEQLWKDLVQKDMKKALDLLSQEYEKGIDFKSLGHEFLKFLREKMHKSIHDGDNLATQKILLAIEHFQKALVELKSSPLVYLPFEIAVINIVQLYGTPVAPHNAPTTPKEIVPPISIPSKQQTPSKEKPTAIKTEEPATPKEETEKESQDKSLPTTPIESLSLNNSTIQDKLPRIAEMADMNAGARIALKKAKVTLDGNKITFSVASEFEAERLNKREIFATLTEVLKRLFGTDFLVSVSSESSARSVGRAEQEFNQETITTDEVKQLFS